MTSLIYLLQEKVSKLVMNSKAYELDPEGVKSLWSRIENITFSLEPRQQQLGLGKKVSVSLENETNKILSMRVKEPIHTLDIWHFCCFRESQLIFLTTVIWRMQNWLRNF